MNTKVTCLLCASALSLACHAPASLAAYAFASADAALTISGPGEAAPYDLSSFEVTPAASVARLGDTLAMTEGEVLLQSDGLIVFGTVMVDALFPPASAASANYNSIQPLLVQNVSGTSVALDLLFEWSLVIEAAADFVAPVENAWATAAISLQQISGGVQSELFSTMAFATIVDGAFAAADVFAFPYTLMADELAVFLVGINVKGEAATAVPLPASLLLLLPAFGIIGRHRRVDA